MCFSSDKRITCREKSPPPTNEGSPHTYSLLTVWTGEGAQSGPEKGGASAAPAACAFLPFRVPRRDTATALCHLVPPRHQTRAARMEAYRRAFIATGSFEPVKHVMVRICPFPHPRHNRHWHSVQHTAVHPNSRPRGAKGCCPRDGVDPRGVFFELPPRPSTARARASRVVATSTSEDA